MVKKKQYSHDMSGETEKKQLLPAGWREFRINDCAPKVSQAGNEMFEIVLWDKEMEQDETVYAIAEQGRRWFLKQILGACDVPASKDGVYEWDISDILGKSVMGKVKHVKGDDWINREGKTVEGIPKAKIVQIAKVEGFKEETEADGKFGVEE